MIRGNMWECGWCGDFGTLSSDDLRQLAMEESASASQTDSLESSLAEWWEDLKTQLEALVPEHYDRVFPHLGKAVLYEITLGLIDAASSLTQDQENELAAFLWNTPDLGCTATISEINNAVQDGHPLYAEEFLLSDDVCGAFWLELIKALPPETYYEYFSDAWKAWLWDIDTVYGYFSGKKLEGAEKREKKLEESFNRHWGRYVLRHPNADRAAKVLCDPEIPLREEACKELLAACYPEIREKYSEDALEGETWQSIVEEYMESDSETAVQMWRTILDAAEPCLREDQELAWELLPNFIQDSWLRECDGAHLLI